MKPLSHWLIASTAILALACKGNSNQANGALNGDSLQAAQTGQETTSPAEQTQASSNSGTTHHHTYNSSSYSSAPAPAPAPQTTYHSQHNGGRDAAIGAGAGAVLGAVTSHDKLKGGVIGAAAGGILGAVVGNNVDTKKVPNN